MKHEFVISEEAHEEVFDAYHWYEDQKAGLGEKFLKHLDNCYKRIDKSPEMYQIVFNTQCQVQIHGFPYVI